MKIAVIGANGQLGSDVVRAVRARDIEVLELTHLQCDVRDAASLARALERVGTGDAVVNTAALHKTDEVETHAQDAVAVNTLGAFNAASAAADRDAAVVYISTDYVFDGNKSVPYVESDSPNPINVYGATKAAGEALVGWFGNHFIIRTSALFGIAGSSGKGGNFIETMIAKARRGERPQVVDDIVTSPTSTADVAGLLVELLQRRAPPGIYHLANEGACSWRELADEVFVQCGFAVRAQLVRSRDLGAPARRPAYSALASERIGQLGLRARPWRAALTDYLRAKGHTS